MPRVFVFHRADCEHVDNVVHLFDWTFTTDYCGTLLGHDDNVLQVRQVQRCWRYVLTGGVMIISFFECSSHCAFQPVECIAVDIVK